jgi:alkylation response protein AidB-like acyl-CoA dehydrogenase
MSDDTTEDLESFRLRARAWLAEHMPRLPPGYTPADERSDREGIWARQRELQRTLWSGGFAGICFPREYGGLGRPSEYQRVFTEESLPYEMPFFLSIPTLSILGATLVDFGTHEQKAKYLPGILRGDHVWVQFLSEPTGGSDLAGTITRADRDGDVWVLNGSKIWSSGAYASDYAMCLARTNWEVPKHRGLTMFIVQIHQPGIQVDRIKQINGTMEFCQEFFDDVVLPADSVIGEVDDGWTVATRLLSHERNAVGGGSPYVSGRNRLAEGIDGMRDSSYTSLATRVERTADPIARQLVAEAHVLDVVQAGLVRRVTAGIASGALPGQSAAILKLFTATSGVRKAEIGLTLGGAAAVTWSEGDRLAAPFGEAFLSRQAECLAGGSNEIQRNIISERVLGMPREWAADRDLPFRDVRRNLLPGARPIA